MVFHFRPPSGGPRCPTRMDPIFPEKKNSTGDQKRLFPAFTPPPRIGACSKTSGAAQKKDERGDPRRSRRERGRHACDRRVGPRSRATPATCSARCPRSLRTWTWRTTTTRPRTMPRPRPSAPLNATSTASRRSATCGIKKKVSLVSIPSKKRQRERGAQRCQTCSPHVLVSSCNALPPAPRAPHKS